MVLGLGQHGDRTWLGSIYFEVYIAEDQMGGASECYGSALCSCMWCCCRRRPGAEKNRAAVEICRLRWNWFYLILLVCLDAINCSSPLPSLHQFITNPTAQQLNRTGRGNKIEAGLGLSERFYHVAMLALSVGELLGAFIGSIGILPLMYNTIAALLCHIVGFVVYAMATSGWMMIAGRVLSGTFVGMQSVLTLAYFGVSYQHYLEVLGPEERTKEEGKTTRVKDILFVLYAVSANIGTLIGPGVAAILAQFPNHFRSIAWFNVILGLGYIFLQLVMLRGESKCHCENPCQTHKCSLPERSKFRRMITYSNLSLILIVGFLILMREFISSEFLIYQQLFNPILSDSFGFSVKQTSYFFLLLLPATLGGVLMVLLLQRLKLNSRIIAILGTFCSMTGMVLMADWQSIPPDPCTNFSLYYHPELSNTLSNISLNPCSIAPSNCQWPPNGASVHNLSAKRDKDVVIESFLQIPESIAHTQKVHPVLNITAYNVAMNVCESLGESQYHCHWIPKATGTLCQACPAICRGIDRTLNFFQFTIGAFIFRGTISITRIAVMIVISDIVRKDYQSIVMGISYASTGVFGIIAPLYIGAAYEGAHKRTFLAMSIMIAPQLPIMLILVLLYHKLGKLRKENMNSDATEFPPSSTYGSSSDQDGASDNENSTEMSELLASEKKLLEESSN